MSTRTSRSIDAVLDKLERSAGLTQDGRDWLIACVDPFHDSDIALAGYPDMTTDSTVVQLIKKQIQVTVPTTGNGTVAGGANWDCQISMFPMSTSQQLFTGVNIQQNTGNQSNPSQTTLVSVGGLVVASGPQGSQMWPDNATPTPTITYQSSVASDFSDFAKGNLRVLGMGFEVINTTAEINKQGQVTVFRMPNVFTPSDSVVTIATTPSVNANIHYLLSRFPPSTLSNAQLLFGSRSWAASEGAYVVSRLSDITNPMTQPVNTCHAWTSVDFDASQAGSAEVWSSTFPLNPMKLNTFHPFDLSGAHFTGLSNTTTLTVTIRWIVERLVGPAEKDLVVLATPSAAYDPLALELYTRCLHNMPPGVMLKENALGDWFRSALSAAGEYLPIVGAALNTSLPGAGAVGNALGVLARSGANLIPKAPAPAKKKKAAARSTARAVKAGPSLPRAPLPGSASNMSQVRSRQGASRALAVARARKT